MSENLIGATTAVFPIRLSVAVASPVDVEWATRDGSAVAGSDYKATAGTVTFLPGETEKQIEVQVYGQAITPSDDKVFFIRLNPPSNAVLVDAILTCTINIIDDQGIPSVAVVVAEGRRGPKGNPGLSAYEQAVLMGYTGTLTEWMDQIADASKAADRAGDHAVSAAEDALKAQNAAKNAVFAGVVFPTASEGVDPILGVPNGAYFNVRSPLSEHYIDEYQNVNGVAVATGKSYPTSDHFQNISEHTALPFVDGTSYKINKRVSLVNGEIVKSTVDGNTNDPNVDITGWVKTNSGSQIELKFNSITNSIKKSLSEYVYDMFIDATWFGAKPDYDFYDKTGTDSTSALQSAIAFISTLGTPRDGGRALIKVPVGSYKATSLSIPQTSSIGYGITIRGDGQFASSLYFDSSSTSPAMTVGIEGLHFEDISIFGYGSSIGIPTGRSVGIVAAKATRACDIDIKFSRCHISGWDKFLDINGRGAVFDGCSAGLTNTVCNIYVTPDLTFSPSNPLAQGESTSLRHYTFLNNRFDAVNHILSVSGSGNMLQHINDVQFIGNDFAATSQIIYAKDTINTIVGLQVVGNTGIASFATAPIIASSVKGLVCLGNHAFNNYVYESIPTTNQNCTESLVQCSGDLSDAIVSNNIVRNLRTELVRVLGNGSNINVTGNILPEAWSFGAAENKFLVLIAGTRSKINIFNNSLTSSNVSGTYRQLNSFSLTDGSVIKDNLADWTWVDSDVTFNSTIYAGTTSLTTEVTTNRVRYTFDGNFIVGNLYLAANTDVSQPVLMNLPVPAILDMSNFGSSYAGGITIHRVIGFSAAGASLVGYVNPTSQRFEFKKVVNLAESNLQWSDGTGNKTIVGSFRYRYK